MRAPRVSDRIDPTVPGRATFSADENDGSGRIHDVSITGARLDEVTLPLEPGTKVHLTFLEPRTERRIRAVGEVVRETESGFAVRFVRVERELKRLVMSAVTRSQEDGE